jgi:hypothetical protein
MSAFPNQIEYFENYKTYGGFKYHLGIPDEWILNELPDTGRECANCVGNNGNNDGFAMWRGIVLGYCANCATTYCGTRCKGFNGYANEWYGNEQYESAYDKYLGNIDLENYGELEANPDDTMENHNRLKVEKQHECDRELNELEKEDAIDRWNEIVQKEMDDEHGICEGCWQCQPNCYEECDDYDDCEDYCGSDDEEEVCLAPKCSKLRVGKSVYCKKHQEVAKPLGKRVI